MGPFFAHTMWLGDLCTLKNKRSGSAHQVLPVISILSENITPDVLESGHVAWLLSYQVYPATLYVYLSQASTGKQPRAAAMEKGARSTSEARKE